MTAPRLIIPLPPEVAGSFKNFVISLNVESQNIYNADRLRIDRKGSEGTETYAL